MPPSFRDSTVEAAEREVAGRGAALLWWSRVETAQKLAIWELFVCEQDFPRGHMGREIQFWIKEKKLNSISYCQNNSWGSE